MEKALVICETRPIADEISRALGGDFAREHEHLEGEALVLAWRGGLRTRLADPEHYDPSLRTWRIDDLPLVPDPFVVVADSVGDGAVEQLRALRALIARRDVVRLVNACDPDPDGELAFADLRELVGGGELPVERAWLGSLARPSIRLAFARLRPGDVTRPLEDAARARAEADWLVGVNGTRAATARGRALGGTITLGRLLTPALALLVAREAGTVEPPVPPEPPALYGLAALQRAAADRYGFTAQRTLMAAREGYEQAVLSYPLTTSGRLPLELGAELAAVAEQVGRASVEHRELAERVAVVEAFPLDDLLDDVPEGGQHALVPTNGRHDLKALGDDARRVYDLVAVRFLEALLSLPGAEPEAPADDVALLEAIGCPEHPEVVERLVGLAYAVREGRRLRPTQKGAQVIGLLGEHPLTRGVGAVADVERLTRDLVRYLRDLPDAQTRFPRRDLGIACPRCGNGTLIEGGRGYGCSTWQSREEPGCGFVIWKTIASRPVDEAIVRELVERGRTRELQGFRSKAGRTFRAALVLDPGAAQPVTFDFKAPGRPGATGRTGA